MNYGDADVGDTLRVYMIRGAVVCSACFWNADLDDEQDDIYIGIKTRHGLISLFTGDNINIVASDPVYPRRITFID